LIKNILTGVILTVAFLLNACSGDALSKEDEIKLYIESGIEAAENRSPDDLAELIDESYLDHKSLNKTQLTNLARLYFFRHKNIYLFTKIKQIEFLADNQALITLYVAMAGSVISDASVLSSLRAKTYQFELELVKQDKWLLRRASWQPASIGDIR
jgi:hypothetical protein